jgi:hypothetical protein
MSIIRKALISIMLTGLIGMATGCKTATQVSGSDTVNIPFLKNSADECYYLDEFMPIPDGLVTGKSGSLNLRYYTYRTASYKDWGMKEIMLSFYSRDSSCWSLFEEYYIAK